LTRTHNAYTHELPWHKVRMKFHSDLKKHLWRSRYSQKYTASVLAQSESST
jgi:hypothetical protein